jgi:hypothetical protein
MITSLIRRTTNFKSVSIRAAVGSWTLCRRTSGPQGSTWSAEVPWNNGSPTDIKGISSVARAVDPWSLHVVPEQDRSRMKNGDHQNGLVEYDVICPESGVIKPLGSLYKLLEPIKAFSFSLLNLHDRVISHVDSRRVIFRTRARLFTQDHSMHSFGTLHVTRMIIQSVLKVSQLMR